MTREQAQADFDQAMTAAREADRRLSELREAYLRWQYDPCRPPQKISEGPACDFCDARWDADVAWRAVLKTGDRLVRSR